VREMIVHPKNWKETGSTVTTERVERELRNVLADINCDCLSFSGGIDSTLLLYFMCRIFKKVRAFTIGKNPQHPDVLSAKDVVEHYREKFTIEHFVHYPLMNELKEMKRENFPGDNVVKMFYRYVSEYTDRIVAGDGVDEFMCGYYSHMESPDFYKTYYDHLRRLQKEHLVPLDLNSGQVLVYLPYIDERVISLLSQIPIEDKVDSKSRKKIMVTMAQGKMSDEVITRRKYGFCDALAGNKH